MSNVDLYLERKAKNIETYDFYNVYESISNKDLRKIFAFLHTELNNWFREINNRIFVEYDYLENVIYKGGYLHAQNSRDFLNIISEFTSLHDDLQGTQYSFEICNDYLNIIIQCRKFVKSSGGSNIPEGFKTIKIENINPIFILKDSISIEHNGKITNRKLKLIGEGSYAKVFSYKDPVYDIFIALKRAKSELNDKELIRFKQEYDILKSLNFPYIVKVYSYDSDKNQYTMEYLDENIWSFIKKTNTTLSLSRRKQIIKQICKGISYIHNKKLLHRDISLTNIFIKHYDEDIDVVKIGDFGLVKTQESILTNIESEIKGSLNDPDLYNVGFNNYEMCHEIYALTKLIYYILTGRTNISRENNEKIKSFLNKGTNVDKNKRFKNVNEILSYIELI